VEVVVDEILMEKQSSDRILGSGVEVVVDKILMEKQSSDRILGSGVEVVARGRCGRRG
jgi:predicted NAD-dependent protein-ADP-ribosyltransferase YbiA (DUF1768 family)